MTTSPDETLPVRPGGDPADAPLAGSPAPGAERAQASGSPSSADGTAGGTAGGSADGPTSEPAGGASDGGTSRASDGERSADSDAARPREVGGQAGPEPTRYGDWEKKGRCTDF